MDANGNLTDLSEFVSFRNIRLISALGDDIALGTSPLEDGIFYAGVRHISAGSPEESVFVTETGSWAGLTFQLGRPDGRAYYLEQQGTHERLRVAFHGWDGPYPPQMPPEFTADFFDGCWFALNNHDRTAVVDIAGSSTDEGTPIVMWPWNGGDNQKWRATTRGPGL